MTTKSDERCCGEDTDYVMDQYEKAFTALVGLSGLCDQCLLESNLRMAAAHAVVAGIDLDEFMTEAVSAFDDAFEENRKIEEIVKADNPIVN